MSPEVTTTSPAAVVRAVSADVSRLVAGGLSAAEHEEQLDRLAGYYAERTDVRHPFAPTGDTPLRSRAELRAHFASATDLLGPIERFTPVDEVVHTTGDPEVVVYEFGYAITAGGTSFTVPHIFVTRVRDGLIVESRDYSHHVAMARGLGHLGDLTAALAGSPG